MIAGGLGGTTGDLLMHSLDTVKTRQQGDLSVPPRYPSMSSSYITILRQEGLRRGLYGGWLPAFLGSFPGTIIFFGTYEYSKRHMIDAGINPQFAYLSSGMISPGVDVGDVTDRHQVLLQILLLLSYMFLPKCSRLGYNSRVVTITLFFSPVIITNRHPMLLGQ